jgi:D-serine deaminase-like pyridoxal phosphate-dependent protein
MKKVELETPALIVDQERLVGNIRNMQETADSAGVLLRPHTKTHNCPELAKLQLETGATGITVQDLSHAEDMSSAGITDILIANEVVDPAKIERLVKLQEKATVKVAVDDLMNAEQIAKTAASQEKIVPVLVDVDVGAGRCGVPFDKVPKLAKKISQLKGVRFDGLMGYEGQFYAKLRNINRQRREKLTKQLIARLVRTAKLIAKSGLDVPIVSCGTTPTASAAARVEGVTEIQPGNYVFYDLMQVEMGVATEEQCAQHVLSTVMSTPNPRRFVVDAGVTTFAHDQARFPKILNVPSATPTEMNQEHLIIRINPKVMHVHVGDKIEFLPYHACPTTNLFDQIYLTKEEKIIATWDVTPQRRLN